MPIVQPDSALLAIRPADRADSGACPGGRHPARPPLPDHQAGSRGNARRAGAAGRRRSWPREALRRRPALLLTPLGGLLLRTVRLGADSLWYDETVVSSFAHLAGSPIGELPSTAATSTRRATTSCSADGSWRPATATDRPVRGLRPEFMAMLLLLFFGVLLIAPTTPPHAGLRGARSRWSRPRHVLEPVQDPAQPGSAHVRPGRGYRRDRASALADATTRGGRRAWSVYAAAAAGMFTVYYFAFLLIPAVVCALAYTLSRRRPIAPCSWRTGRAGALCTVAAHRVAPATGPPVPWRTAPTRGTRWGKLTAPLLGQSAPGWLWPVLVVLRCWP